MQTAPPNCGLLFFEKLHGSIEDKFPCRYFLGRVKNKNQTIWVYSEKFAFQILNFFKMSISEPVFSLQTHIQLFMRCLQRILYLTTQFFCIDPKHRTPRRMECPSEDVCREVVIFSRKVLNIRVERTGRSRQADVAMDGNWSRARAVQNRYSLFVRKFPPGDLTSRKDIPSAMGVRGFVSLTLNLPVLSNYSCCKVLTTYKNMK